MERRNSISGRLSLSTANITSPIAESTHINGTSLHSNFPWGGKMCSPPKSCEIVQKRTPRIQMSPINKIDPRVYIDVQSRGLASRIVKYHENSHKLSRSFSTGNLYNKPGQFPVVHLKKKEIPYKPSRNINVSMVRIAPPDKSIFQANTRSSILRTGSIVPTVSLNRGNEQISGENRPILHPAGNDIAPTRSVLDALREISRKRINSDELDSSDNVKKYCKEQDEASGTVQLRPSYNSSISKRQREAHSPLHLVTGTSPEQVSKKRLCSRNNDITSSLSSSIMMTIPKRKFNDIQNQKSPDKIIQSDSPSPPKSKQQCHNSKYVPFQNFENILAGQITPLPATPAVEITKSQEIDVVVKSDNKIAVASSVKAKPKLTLFNKNYDETSASEIDNNFNSKLDDYESSAVKFVKPKNNSQVSLEVNPLIERTNRSKLALMLSGLSGDLNEDEFDAVQKPNEISTDTKDTANSLATSIASLTTPVTMSACISFETKTTASTTTVPATSAMTQAGQDKLDTPKENLINNAALTSVPNSTAIKSTTITSTTATTNGFAFPTVVTKNPMTEISTPPSSISDSKPISIGFTLGGSKPIVSTEAPSVASQNTQPSSTPTTKFSSMPLTSIGFDTAAQTTPTTSSNKLNTLGAVNWTDMSSSTTKNTSDEKTAFRIPVTSSNLPNLFKNTTTTTAPASSIASSLSFNSPLKPTLTFLSSSGADSSNVSKPFGITPSQSTPTVSTPTVSKSAENQLGSFTTHQKPSFSTGNSFPTTNSGFTIPATLPFQFATENAKPQNSLSENKSSTTGGFSFKPSNPTVSPSKPINFMYQPDLHKNQISTTSTSGFAINTTTSTPGGFSFPASATALNSSTATETKPAFSFSANNSTTSSGFAILGNVTQSKPQNTLNTTFVSSNQQHPTQSPLSTSTMQQVNPNPFAFGVPQTQQNTATTSGIFEASKSESKPNAFVFSNSSQPQNTIATNDVFNSGAGAFSVVPVQSTATSSIFGTPGNTAFTTPATTSSMFVIATTTSNSNPVFGVPATTSISGFVQPGAVKSSIFGSPSTENKPATFIFGGSTAGNNSSAPNKSFSFGGSTSTTSSGFSFNPPSNVVENKNLFTTPGSTSNSFAFGATTANNNATKPMFGAAISNNNTTTVSPFGSSGLEQPKGFNFKAGPSNLAPSNSFGATLDNKSDKTFGFEATKQQNANQNNNNAFNFGANPSSSPFGIQATSTQETGRIPGHGISSPPFDFSTASNASTPNPFKVGASASSTTTAGDRVIRKAARRIK